MTSAKFRTPKLSTSNFKMTITQTHNSKSRYSLSHFLPFVCIRLLHGYVMTVVMHACDIN